MVKLITLVALVVALAAGTSMLALTDHANRTHTHIAGHQTAFLLH